MYEYEFIDTWDYLTHLDEPTADELEAINNE